MTPEKRILIKAFIDHKEMAEAVREVLLAAIKEQGTESWVLAIDRTMDDAEYGQYVKSIAQGLQFLKNGFAQLTHIANSAEGVQSRQNEAR